MFPRDRLLTWHISQRAVAIWQRKTQLDWLGALIAYGQLNQQSSHGHLQIQAILQHLGFSHGSLGGEIDGHQAFELLTETVSSRAGTLLSVPPGNLQPMQVLVDFYHLIMQPAPKKAEETRSGKPMWGNVV